MLYTKPLFKLADLAHDQRQASQQLCFTQPKPTKNQCEIYSHPASHSVSLCFYLLLPPPSQPLRSLHLCHDVTACTLCPAHNFFLNGAGKFVP